jgi:serine/threonine protein kinase
MEHHNYHFKEIVGKGGMSTVYLGEHKTLLKPVAIKVLNKEYIHNINIRNRFLEEARNMFSMSHHNIVRSTDLIDQDDMVAFVMEYVTGKTIKQLLEEKAQLTNDEIATIFKQILNAVGYIHTQGLVHRDIKPSNFLLNENWELKLMDFGIAKNNNLDNSDFTNTALNMGTTMYMSPEQIRSTKDVTAQSDIYSLGVLLWQMVTGGKPYEVDTMSTFDIQVKIVNEPLPLTNTIWDEIIQKATEKNLDKRINSCSYFLSEIEKIDLKNKSGNLSQSTLEVRKEEHVTINTIEANIENNIFRCIEVNDNGVRKHGLINKKGEWLTQSFLNIFDKYELGKNKDYYIVNINDRIGIIRKDGVIVVQPIFDAINIDNKLYARIQINNLWGIINYKGDWIIQPKFQNLPWIFDDFFQAEINNKTGIIDFNNNWIIEPNYADISYSTFNDNNVEIFIVQNGDTKKYGVKSKTGELLIPEIFDYIQKFSDDLGGILKFDTVDLYGLCDLKGNIIIQPLFNYLQTRNFYIPTNNEKTNSAIIATKDWKDGVINLKGEVLIGFNYETLISIYIDQQLNALSDLFIAKQNGKFGIIDIRENWIIHCNYEEIEYNNYGNNFWVKKDGLWGMIDWENNWILKPVYHSKNIKWINDEKTIWNIEKDGKWGCLNTNNKFFIGIILDEEPYSDLWNDIHPFTDDYAIVKINGKYGCINTNAEITLPCTYDTPDEIIITEGMAHYKKNDKIGFIDVKNGETIFPLYDVATAWNNGYCVVTINDQQGLIDRKGNWKISPNFEYLNMGIYDEFLLVAKQNGKFGYLNYDGSWAIYPIYDWVEEFKEDGYAEVWINGKMGFIDKKGNWLIQPKFDFVETDEEEEEEEEDDEEEEEDDEEED